MCNSQSFKSCSCENYQQWKLFGRKISIISVVNQKTHDGKNLYYSSFNLKDQNYCQNRKDEMCKSDEPNEKLNFWKSIARQS